MTESDWQELHEKVPRHMALDDALRIQGMMQELKDQREHIKALEEAVKAMQKERDSMLKWGVISLGGAVLGMGVYIWTLIAERVFK